MIERRRHLRAPFLVEVEVLATPGGSRFKSRLRDVNLHGATLESPYRILPGWELRLTVPDAKMPGQSEEVSAVVIHVREQPAVSLLGIEFLGGGLMEVTHPRFHRAILDVLRRAPPRIA